MEVNGNRTQSGIAASNTQPNRNARRWNESEQAPHQDSAPRWQNILAAVCLVGLASGPFVADAEVPVAIDVDPGECPNFLNVNSHGYLSVAILGDPANGFDVNAVRLDTVRLHRLDGVDTLGGQIAKVAAIGTSAPPVIALSQFGVLPVASVQDQAGICTSIGTSGATDLILRFSIADLVHSLGLDNLPGGATVPLGVTGTLQNGTNFSSFGAPDFVTLVVPSAPAVAVAQGNEITVTAAIGGPPSTSLEAVVSGNPRKLSGLQWSQEGGRTDGVGEVDFNPSDQLATDASFLWAGDYLLTFSASKGQGGGHAGIGDAGLSGQDIVKVTVNLDPHGAGILDPNSISNRLFTTDPVRDMTQFLTFGGNVTDEKTAQAYYEAIDPTSEKTNFTSWLIKNNMSDGGFPPNTPDPTKVVTAAYFNAIDLGFGRRMVMRKSDGKAWVVTNYRTVDDAINNVNPIAAVAMEFDPFTKFYVYNFYQNNGDRVTAADLDGGGLKAVPGLCIVCHGGLNPPNVANFGDPYPNPGGNVHAHFLPFDLKALEFSPSLSSEAQEATFKTFNANVLAIEKVSLGSDGRPMKGLIDLIEGWYGGSALPSPKQNTEFVPADWSGHTNLYLGLVARSCRNCHSTRTTADNFASFNNFDVLKSLDSAFVLGSIMPQARRTFERLWLNTSALPLPTTTNPNALLPEAGLLQQYSTLGAAAIDP